MSDMADVNLGAWHPEAQRWDFGMTKLSSVKLLTLHVDGRTAEPADWEATGSGIMWKGGPLDAPGKAYVTVRVATAARRLTDGQLALIGVILTAVAGFAGVAITSWTSACPDKLDVATAQISSISKQRQQCTVVVGTLTRLCSGTAARNTASGQESKVAALRQQHSRRSR